MAAADRANTRGSQSSAAMKRVASLDQLRGNAASSQTTRLPGVVPAAVWALQRPVRQYGDALVRRLASSSGGHVANVTRHLSSSSLQVRVYVYVCVCCEACGLMCC